MSRYILEPLRPLLPWSPDPFEEFKIWTANNKLQRQENMPDCKRTDEKTIVTFVVPGFGKENIKLTLDKGTLEMSAKTEDLSAHQSIYIGEHVDPKTHKAECKNGILRVEFQHVKPEDTRQIIKID